MVRLTATSGIPPALADLEKAVQQKYPDLRLTVGALSPVFRGSFPVMNEGEVLDRFSIRISFPEGINKLPEIQEIGGRIPRTAERHNSGAICTDVPELILLRGKYSLVSYLDGPVRTYFFGQMMVERGEEWPFGEWEHGKAGLLQAYGEILEVEGETTIRRFLDCLAHKKVKGHWPCPCGSGKRIRDCHAARLRQLHESVSLGIAKQALKRLDQYPEG